MNKYNEKSKNKNRSQLKNSVRLGWSLSFMPHLNDLQSWLMCSTRKYFMVDMTNLLISHYHLATGIHKIVIPNQVAAPCIL